jgi:hypothetical protein
MIIKNYTKQDEWLSVTHSLHHPFCKSLQGDFVLAGRESSWEPGAALKMLK